MKVILFRYSPRAVMLEKLASAHLVLAPENQRVKYQAFEASGHTLPNLRFFEDYSLPTIVGIIREIAVDNKITSITTLSEDDMDWVGLLADYFVHGLSSFGSGALFKDKYYMRSFLFGQVAQPDFRLLTSPDDLAQFWSQTSSDQALVKPRVGAGSQGIFRLTRDQALDETYYSGHYLIEGFVASQKMITADGYARGQDIIRLVSHEYDQPLLDMLGSGYGVTRTNRAYFGQEQEGLSQLFETSQRVLALLAKTQELTPFHFEWFVGEREGDLIFCEVGKRFGGASIPFITQYAFGFDLLGEYWRTVDSGDYLPAINSLSDLPKPQCIAACFIANHRPGRVLAMPEQADFDWTCNTWLFVSPGQELAPARSVIENAFLSEFTAEGERDYDQKLERLKRLAQQVVIEEVDDDPTA